MPWTVAEFFAYMESPEYKAEVAAKRRAREDAEDAYFDALGELVERHPIGRPISHRALVNASGDHDDTPTESFAQNAPKSEAASAPDFSRITRNISRKSGPH